MNAISSTTLMQASRQWAARPADERFVSLTDMQAHFNDLRAASREVVCSSRRIQAVPQDDHRGILIEGPNGHGYAPTHWSFGQLATLAGAPAGYLRKLPAELAADCINVGLKVLRDVEDVGCLLYRPDGVEPMLRAATLRKIAEIEQNEIAVFAGQHFAETDKKLPHTEAAATILRYDAGRSRRTLPQQPPHDRMAIPMRRGMR